MNLHFDEDLVEAAVLLCTTGSRKGVSAIQITRFHREREKLYSILDPDVRNAAFFKLHLEWFREWDMEKRLTEPLREFPLLPGALKLLAFRKAQGKKDDGAELYVNEAGERHGVVSICAELLVRERQLGSFLRHELTHLHDMIDPGFGYFPDLAVAGPSLSQHRLARERYRLLWDITIDGRLSRSEEGEGNRSIGGFSRSGAVSAVPAQEGARGSLQGEGIRERRWREFKAGFAFWAEAEQREIFDRLWASPAPTHKDLEQLVCDPRHLRANSGPQPGGPCPLCGFPTFSWAAPGAFAANVLAAIQAEFPDWGPADGACARCASMFRVSSSQKIVTV